MTMAEMVSVECVRPWPWENLGHGENLQIAGHGVTLSDWIGHSLTPVSDLSTMAAVVVDSSVASMVVDVRVTIEIVIRVQSILVQV